MPGLRDILLVLLVLAAVYLVFMLVRLTRVGRQRKRREVPASPPAEPMVATPPLSQRAMEPPIAPDVAIAAYEEEGVEQNFTVPPVPTFEWNDVKDLFGEAAPEAVAAPGASLMAEPPRQGGFGEALADHLARSDMELEMQRMRDEMERMRKEVEEIRTARRVSPQYAEAMELAQRGCTAQDVADRLGISLAEAELVHALSRGRRNFEEGEEHGANGNA